MLQVSRLGRSQWGNADMFDPSTWTAPSPDVFNTDTAPGYSLYDPSSWTPFNSDIAPRGGNVFNTDTNSYGNNGNMFNVANALIAGGAAGAAMAANGGIVPGQGQMPAGMMPLSIKPWYAKPAPYIIGGALIIALILLAK